MENLFAELLTRALHSVNPLMGDGSRLVTDQYCEQCRSSGLHEGALIRCECWCHPARAALGAARAGCDAEQAGGAHRAPPAPAGQCPVCASPVRRRIEMRLFQGAAAAQALEGLGRCGLSIADIQTHFECGHLSADAGMLVASLIELLGSASNRVGGPGPKDASLAALNQSHKLRLEVIKLIADITRGGRGGGSPHLVSQPIGMLLSDAQATEMRKLAAHRS